MRNVDLSKINDFYIREILKQIVESVAGLELDGSGETKIINNITNISGDKLDGTDEITGTITPETTDTYSLGSASKRFNEIHTKEMYISGSTLFVEGKETLKIEDSKLTLTSNLNEDVQIKSKGSGKVIIDADAEVEINSGGVVNLIGSVSNNGSPLFEGQWNTQFFDTGTISGRSAILAHIPVSNGERVIYNGIELSEGLDKDYTISANTVTLNFDLLGDDLLKVSYNY